ncbi:MAG: M4 family metallopeptidase, partial [Bacteroidota bacterium]
SIIGVILIAIAGSNTLLAQSEYFSAIAKLKSQGVEISDDLPSQSGYLALKLANIELGLDGSSTQQKAQSFLSAYAKAWNLRPEELRTTRTETDQLGGTHLFYEQKINGIAVEGVEFSLHFQSNGELTSAAGTSLPMLEYQRNGLPQVETHPTIRGQALTVDAFQLSPYLYLKNVSDPHNWSVTEVTPVYIIPGLIDGTDRRTPMAAYRLELRASESFRVYDIYIDANSFQAILKAPRHCSMLSRRLYNTSMSSSNLIWQEGDDFPGVLNTDQQELIRHTEQTYNFFFRTFGRDSYDNNGGTKNIIYNPFFIDCPNANSGEGRISVCPGVVADDVSAHEWTHTHIVNTSRMIYAFESGAVNEGLADIFGEVLDLINGTGNDAGISAHRQNCIETNTRWKIGEDITALPTHIRDMAFPNCRNDPDDRHDPFYYCGLEDYGGVHINSGLVNRSFVLLSDGGTHNGVSVDAIGLTKSAHLFAHAMFYYATRVTDIHAFGDQLRLAGLDLIGQDLPALTSDDAPAGSSGEVFSLSDLHALDSAIVAVELQKPSLCQFETVLAQDVPEACPAASVLVFEEDWENGMGNWIVSEEPEDSSSWLERSWQMDSLLPDGRTGYGVFAPTPYTTDCLNETQNGTLRLISPSITIPDTIQELVLSFDHYFSLEEGRDGGLVLMQVNDGNWTQIPPSAFSYNAYNLELDQILINDNPDAGSWSFSGSDANSTTGTWGTSQVNLISAGAQFGDSIRLAWHLSTDGCDAWLGWFLDEVEIRGCLEEALPVELIGFTGSQTNNGIIL